MKCDHCGTEIRPGARLCEACGAPVQENNIPQKADESQPANFTNPEQLEEESPYNPPIPQPDPMAQTPFHASETFDLPGGAVAYPQPVQTGQAEGASSDPLALLSIILGGAGIIFSCVGCGGLFSLAGLITGFLALKTPNRPTARIGLILSGVGMVISVLTICAAAIFLISGMASGV